MAVGSVRPGLRVSEPVNVTLFQADCENKGPIIASPSSMGSARAPSREKSGEAVLGSQPLAVASHHDEAQAAAFVFAPSVSPRTTSPSRAAVLVKVKEFWIHFPSFRPPMFTAVRKTTRMR